MTYNDVEGRWVIGANLVGLNLERLTILAPALVACQSVSLLSCLLSQQQTSVLSPQQTSVLDLQQKAAMQCNDSSCSVLPCNKSHNSWALGA